LKELDEVTKEDMVLCYGEEGGSVWHEVDEICTWEMKEPIKIKHKRIDSLIVPINQTILTYDGEFNWKRAKSIEKKDRIVVPLDHDYLDCLEDRFWCKFSNFDQKPKYATGIVRGTSKIDMDFLEYIHEENPSLEEAMSKYSEKKLKKYDNFLTQDGKVLYLSTSTSKQLFQDYIYLKVKGKSQNYVTTGGTLKVNV